CTAMFIGLMAGGWGVYDTHAAVRSERVTEAPDQPAKDARTVEKKIELPDGPAPGQVLASLDKEKRLVVQTNVQLPGETGVQFGAVHAQAGGVQPNPPKFLPPVVIGEIRTRTYDLDKVEVFDTKGKKLDKKEVVKRLTQETLAVASLDGEQVDRRHLRLIKDGTLVFVFPMPEQGVVVPVPAVPAVPSSPPIVPPSAEAL